MTRQDTDLPHQAGGELARGKKGFMDTRFVNVCASLDLCVVEPRSSEEGKEQREYILSCGDRQCAQSRSRSACLDVQYI